jgi:PTH1 family peptidyl-tRNA hydrolase
MNNSGFAIKELFLFFKLNSDDLVVVHDDLDLKVGKIKVKVGGGHGGHNGLRSIDQQISKEYLRLRIGIDRPVNKSQVANYVLSNFSEKDKYTIDNVIDLITQDFEILANKDIKKFINSINQKLGKVAIKSESTNNKLQAKVLPSFKDLLNSIIK